MVDFIAKLLVGLAGLMDKYIPGKGARTYTASMLVIVSQIALYLTGQETAQVAATSIIGQISVIFAAMHDNKP